MTNPKQLIDGELGSGWYDQWQEFKRDFEIEKQRAQNNKSRFNLVQANAQTDTLTLDLQRLELIAQSYERMMAKIIRGERYNFDRVWALNGLYSLALGVVREDNNALDIIFASGVLAGFVAIPLALLQKHSDDLLKLINKLIPLLEQAKREQSEAQIQTGINLAITAATMLVPHVSLLARGSIFVFQWVVDDRLGPQTTAAATVGSKASLTISNFGDAVSEVEKMGRKNQRVVIKSSATNRAIKRAGKVAVITGFFSTLTKF